MVARSPMPPVAASLLYPSSLRVVRKTAFKCCPSPDHSGSDSGNLRRNRRVQGTPRASVVSSLPGDVPLFRRGPRPAAVTALPGASPAAASGRAGPARHRDGIDRRPFRRRSPRPGTTRLARERAAHCLAGTSPGSSSGLPPLDGPGSYSGHTPGLRRLKHVADISHAPVTKPAASSPSQVSDGRCHGRSRR
jgi:hypothetical protein